MTESPGKSEFIPASQAAEDSIIGSVTILEESPTEGPESFTATSFSAVEVRILPTYEVVANIGLLNTYSGLIFPLIASATATFLFRQFFLTVPNEIIEAAKIDGAKPIRFFIDVLIPISRVNIAALFVIMFIFGWNQYLWPILMTTDPSMSTIIMGVDMMIGGSDDVTTWPVVMAASILSMLPPIIVVLSMQKLFIRGLTDSDK